MLNGKVAVTAGCTGFEPENTVIIAGLNDLKSSFCALYYLPVLNIGG